MRIDLVTSWLGALQNMQRGDRRRDCGICLNFKYAPVAGAAAGRRLLRRLSSRWEHFSGDPVYPVLGLGVYSGRSGENHRAESLYDNTPNKWDPSTEYGAARIKLLDYFVAECRNLLHLLQIQAALVALHSAVMMEDGAPLPMDGICANVDRILLDMDYSADGSSYIMAAAPYWEHFSGSKAFPVPATRSGSLAARFKGGVRIMARSAHAANMYKKAQEEDCNMWDAGEYSELRRELLDYLIARITEEVAAYE